MLSDISLDLFHKVFKSHKKTAVRLRREPVAHRKKRLRSIKQWIFDHRADIQQGLNLDLNKSPQEADLTEIYPILTELKHALANVDDWSSPETHSGNLTFAGTSATTHYEPKGTSLIISPWNYPFSLALGPMISAIAAGNTVVLKPSEFTPGTNKVIGRLCEELFSEDMISIQEGEADVAQELLRLPFDHIFFTGSPSVGKLVMQAAAKNLSSVTLELGGKSPTIVDQTADINDAAAKIAWGKWLNAGQTCVAPDYLFIHRSVKEPFIESLKNQADILYSNDEKYVRIINNKHFIRLNTMVEEALAAGATLAFGGKASLQTLKMPPLAISDPPSDSRLMQDEIFGPVLAILTYEELDEVIDYVNARPKPLALYYFTRNKRSLKRIVKETTSGTVVINDAVLQFGHPSLPFGGVNNSGIGKSHGKAGFLAFSNEKSVLKQRVGFTMAKTVYPPYTALKNKMIDLLLKYF